MRAARKVSAVAALGTAIVVVGSLGVASAATGGNFILGHVNKANATSVLQGTAGTPLSLVAPAGKAPLKVNRSVKVANLNADKLDGLDSTQFLRSVSHPTWHSLSLANGWAFYGDYGYGSTVQYAKDAFGFVHLRGVVSSGSKTSDVMGTLPIGFRPPKGAWVVAGDSNGAYDPHLINIWIEQSGNLNVLYGPSATGSFISLEGISFYAG